MIFSPFSKTSSVEDSIEPPNRSKRKECWDSRDRYFDCLKKYHHNQIISSSSSSRIESSSSSSSINRYYFVPGEEDERTCGDQRKSYHLNCAKSWVDHFNKRIVNDQRSIATQLALSNNSKV
ncbi:cytochrome oxidase c subunit VIb-domain-containing protein [Phakopsora pachyrhizi]|uniref:Cytochrome oxidase c subunit VIb-domain-containing protein n=1 Tax=Phakopsora pachyrhizi TaxID=170000 RepID=A0AAV0BRG9_PHAPC|nr:cytochrome oxidase c subunit VIb-domain-containing protein [Phakopsora pachyrhizi]CAH7689702.1 cytochrome oxidase c subunit VIb-domain-containing protein [Phakopsora pachyrhizi]